jgi:hypothetical protein
MTVDPEKLEKSYDLTEAAKDERIKQVVREKIETIAKQIKKPIPISANNPITKLFSTTEDGCHLDSADGQEIIVENKHMQELGLEVLREYGLNPSISKLRPHSPKNIELDAEIVDYPSQTIENLSFRRKRVWAAGANNRIALVEWSAVDKTPFLKVNVKKIPKK